MSPTWLRSRVRHYAVQVGLGFTPKVVFSEREWQKATPKAQWKKWDHKSLGFAYDTVVGMSIPDLCCRRTSDETCAHEVYHLLRPQARHGKGFDHAVQEMVLGRPV